MIDNDKLIYPKNTSIKSLKKHQQIKWYINKNIFKYLKKNTYIGKLIESDIYNGLWSISIYPNGMNDKYAGQVRLTLYIPRECT